MCNFTKMGFLCVNFLFQVVAILAFHSGNAQEQDNLNLTEFTFININECKNSEFYDLNIFSCVACGKDEENLQSTADKFSCECAPNFTTVAIYDTQRKNPLCKMCRDDCQVLEANASKTLCEFKLINFTQSTNYYIQRSSTTSRSIRLSPATISHTNSSTHICNICDLNYNFRYMDYCIGNGLLKPYLKYNSFWQSTSSSAVHFGDLKYVAFFCLALHNNTACNQLANLCIMSHFSIDNNSPCSAFLLTQVSDVVIKYASMDENLRATKPPLFFKKGKITAKMLRDNLIISTSSNSKEIKRLELFSTVYALDGKLRRWGVFNIGQVNLCQMNALSNVADDWRSNWEIPFAKYTEPIQCKLTTENLIDLAKINANDNFISIYLNITEAAIEGRIKTKLIILPVLIEDISADNYRSHPEEWQLVKRFQLIEAQPRQTKIHTQQKKYEDEFKLSIYRSLRYVESFEIQYKIHNDNQIGLPLVKLHYRHLDLSANVRLNEIYPFKMQITFIRTGEDTERKFIYEILLPAFLLIALALAILQMYNYRKHRTGLLSTEMSSDVCISSSYLPEFLLYCASYSANAMLLCYIIYIFVYPLEFILQRTVEVTLPVIKNDQRSLQILIYAAFLLKLIFVCVHFWRISSFDLFFIDWERPRSCENNHFTFKNTLETSSVCSSVRTFASENVSAWRIFYVANEWIRLSVYQKHSVALQGLLVLPLAQMFINNGLISKDLGLQLFFITISSLIIYIVQLIIRKFIFNRIFGDPLKIFIDLCSLCNVSVFMMLEQSFGFYIHGRSPNGFADTDMYSMLIQMQRDSQQRFSRKGLHGDSDQQSYIILPPLKLRVYFEKLLAPFERSHNMSQAQYQKDVNTIDSTLERNSAAFGSLNRFLCAFIDHAIKDIDYIIKEKTFIEKALNCEFQSYLTESKGTFYIDDAKSFDRLLLYGNHFNIIVMELTLLIAIYMLTNNLTISTLAVYLLNKIEKFTIGLFIAYLYFVRLFRKLLRKRKLGYQQNESIIESYIYEQD